MAQPTDDSPSPLLRGEGRERGPFAIPGRRFVGGTHEPGCEKASSPLPSPPEEERQASQWAGSVDSKRGFRSTNSLVNIIRRARALSLLSVVIPARDEASCIGQTVERLHRELAAHLIPHEIVVIDDSSSDSTWSVLTRLKTRVPQLVAIKNNGPHGFGRAIACGLDAIRGDAVVIMMGDDSDDPCKVVEYWEKLNQGWDCVFGSRFVEGGGVVDYPKFKLLMNRLANWFLRLLFAMPLNDTTNGFKAYRKEVIDACRPLTSTHFNLTVELPLKAITRGCSWTIIPITYRNRRAGVSKWSMLKMCGPYLLTSLRIWLEKRRPRACQGQPPRLPAQPVIS